MIIKILKFIFITLGFIFFVLIATVVAFVVIDPFNLRTLISDLKTAGINTKNLPEKITPVTIDCFIKTLGEKRAQEIAGGNVPNLSDVLKAKDCLTK